MKWKLIHLASVYSLTHSLSDSLICPHDALESHLQLFPGFRPCFILFNIIIMLQGIVEMTRTFGLELSESVLSNYSPVFYKYQPFRLLLKVQ